MLRKGNATEAKQAFGNLGTAATVFEGIRAYWNEERQALMVFKLKDHMKRLGDSMKLQRMKRRFSQEQLEQAVVDLLRANAPRGDTYISPRAFFDPLGAWALAEDPESVQVLITCWLRPSRLARGEPVHVCVSSWTRIADNIVPPRIKCVSNYQNSRLAAWEAHLNGYDNAILLDGRGKVSEATTACLFIVRDGLPLPRARLAAFLRVSPARRCSSCSARNWVFPPRKGTSIVRSCTWRTKPSSVVQEGVRLRH